MRQNQAVTHVTLIHSVQLKGKTLTKTLFDGRESLPGVQMSISPIGVVCRYQGRSFVVPYANCGTIILAEEPAAKGDVKE